MKYYFCDNDSHTKQICTDKDNPRCNVCGAVMTYGKFTDSYINATIIKPGIHKALDGSLYQIDKAFIIQY